MATQEIRNMNIKEFMDKLVETMKEDSDYLFSWQSNIAMGFIDAYNEASDKSNIHEIANAGAKRFLDLLTYTPTGE